MPDPDGIEAQIEQGSDEDHVLEPRAPDESGVEENAYKYVAEGDGGAAFAQEFGDLAARGMALEVGRHALHVVELGRRPHELCEEAEEEERDGKAGAEDQLGHGRKGAAAAREDPFNCVVMDRFDLVGNPARLEHREGDRAGSSNQQARKADLIKQ